MALPIDVRDILSSSSKYRAEREKPIRVAVFIDAEAAPAAVEALKLALRPQTGHAMLHVEAVVPGDVLDVDSSGDVVIGLAGPGRTLEASLRKCRERFIPTVLVGLEADRDSLASRHSHPILDTIAELQPDDLVASMGRWLADRVEGKRVSLAANFSFVRRAVAEEAVKSTAFQNAVIGGVVVIPGADMPLMTANQAKMVMQIAAVYGEPLGAERIKEIATVVGGAFAFRTIARQAVAFLPGFGWAIKAGIGYSATLAMGFAAIEYFESGADLSGLADKIKEARDHAVRTASRKRDGGQREVIPAHAIVVEEEVPGGASSAPASLTAADVVSEDSGMGPA